MDVATVDNELVVGRNALLVKPSYKWRLDTRSGNRRVLPADIN